LYKGWYKNRGYNPVVPLTIYRRHSVDCRVHKLRLKAYEKKYFKDCDCPIWLTGSTDTESYPRQALGLRDWPAAEAKLRSLSAESKDQTVHGPKLEECITRYLARRRETEDAGAIQAAAGQAEGLRAREEQVLHPRAER
jgi:hypothetical protein